MLAEELDRKLESRGGMSDELATKEARFRKLWSARLGAQMAELPPFDDAYRSVCRTLRAAGVMDR